MIMTIVPCTLLCLRQIAIRPQLVPGPKDVFRLYHRIPGRLGFLLLPLTLTFRLRNRY
jgi:hypothetical protein